MFDNIILEPEQTDLFTRLVEAARAVPRESFDLRHTLGTAEGYARLHHPGLGTQGTQAHVGHLKALRDAGLITWEQLSRGLIQFDVALLGSRYYDHLKEPRYTTEQQFHRVLQAIAKHEQQEFNPNAPDTFIAQELNLPMEQVRAYMDQLVADGFTGEANTQEARWSWLKSKGRIALDDPNFLTRRQQPAVQNISWNAHNAIVNIGSSLHSATQTLNAAGSLDQTTKQQLLALVEQLQKELQNTPPDKADDAEIVAEEAQRVVELATRERPNRRHIMISGQGLKQAAENLAAVASPVLTIVDRIVDLVQRMPT